MTQFESAAPLSADEIDLWLKSFDEVELARHGWSIVRLTEAFQQYDYVYWRPEGSPVISCIFYHLPAPNLLEVLFLATEPSSRRAAGMQNLLGALLKHHANCQIWLECRQDNGIAIDLYKKLGFRPGHQRLGYYRDGTAAILFDF